GPLGRLNSQVADRHLEVLDLLPRIAGAVPLEAVRVEPERPVGRHLRAGQPGPRTAGWEQGADRLRGRRLDFRYEVLVSVDRVSADAERRARTEIDVGVLARLQLLAPNGDFNRPAVEPDVLHPVAVPGARAAAPADTVRGHGHPPEPGVPDPGGANEE